MTSQYSRDYTHILTEDAMVDISLTPLLHEIASPQLQYRRCLHHLVDEQVKRTPDAIALHYEDACITYRVLQEKAEQLASHLSALGVKPDMLVGICMERSLEMVIGLLAILKAGGAYVPFDPTYPQERLAFMLADSQVSVVLVQERVRSLVADGTRHSICIDTFLKQAANEPVGVTAWPVVEPGHLAYMIYTSGSTGKPKGAMNTHQAICNRLLWMQKMYNASSTDVIVQKTPFSFDVSVWEFFWPLICGARLVIAKPGGHQHPEYLARLIIECGVSILHFVPPMLRVFLQEPLAVSCKSLRAVMCSGEALPFELQCLFYQRWQHVQLHNLYGPTEAAVDVTYWVCQEHDPRGIVPIGYPIDHISVYLLNGHGQPVGADDQGELYIGGVGLARGYFGRPELTAERFVPDPFSAEPGARLYKTGDLAQFLSDGSIHYIGRIDNQVKVRGHRIELGEIEHALVAHAAIQACVVLLREDVPGDRRLVAYVLAEQKLPSVTVLRAFLQTVLPEYMIPSTFVQIQEFPLSPNGKIDRRALPAPDSERPELADVYHAPRSWVEEQLSLIWQQVLHVKQIGIHDNFFALGGDSILGIQIVARAHQVGLQISSDHLFAYQTIAELSEVVEIITIDSVIPEEVESTIGGTVPLTPIQQWFFAQELGMQQHHWNQAYWVEVPTDLPIHFWQQFLQQCYERYDAWRLQFRQTEQGWQALQGTMPQALPLRVVSLRGLSMIQQESTRLDAVQWAQSSLDLQHGPLVRWIIFVGAEEGKNQLFMVAHHLVIDAVSWRILFEDIQKALQQYRQSGNLSFAKPATSWQRWSVTQQRAAQHEQYVKQCAYWQHVVAEEQLLRVPVESTEATNYVCDMRSIEVHLSASETQDVLQRVPAVYHTQIQEVLLTALAVALCKWTGYERAVIDVEGHGREDVHPAMNLADVVGWFTTLYPVCLPGNAKTGLIGVLQSIKEYMRAIPQRGIGYGMLRYLHADEILRAQLSNATPDVSFNYLGQLDQMQSDDVQPLSLDIGVVRSLEGKRAHLIEIEGWVRAGHLCFEWQYNQNVHQYETIQQTAQVFMDTLKELIALCADHRFGIYTPVDFPSCQLTQPQLDALLVDCERQAALSPYPLRIQDVYPLSPMQHGIVLQSQNSSIQGLYHVQMHVQIQQELDLAAFQRSWQCVIERHTALRTSIYHYADGTLRQLVWQGAQMPIRIEDWRAYTPKAQAEKLENYVQADQLEGFDLQQVPLARLAIFQVDEKQYHIIWSFHHALLDGWSFSLVFQEVETYYRAFSQSEAVTRDGGVRRPYRQYIDWLGQQDLTAAADFWREYMRGFTQATPFLLDTHGATSPSAESVCYEQIVYRFSQEQTSALQTIGRTHQLTLNTIIQGMWSLLLSQYSGERDIVFGTVSSGRSAALPNIDRLVGLCINTLPLRVAISLQEQCIAWLQQIQSHYRLLRQYEYTPLVNIQQWSAVAPGQPLFESILVFENYPVGEQSMLNVRSVENYERTNYPLTLVAQPGQQLTLKLSYDTTRFTSIHIERILEQLCAFVHSFTQYPQLSVQALLLLSQHQAFYEYSETKASFKAWDTLFREQVERTPDAIALTWQDQHISYAELDQCTHHVAANLQAHGVGPEKIVALCMHRSPEAILGMFAILRAGGVYMPLDPLYPQERLASMLADAQPHLVLTQSRLISALPTLASPVLSIDAHSCKNEQEMKKGRDIEALPQQVAYIIYTSGSTGKPKGVMVTQAGLQNLFSAQSSAFRCEPGKRILQFASLSFDASVSEVAMALLSGATLCLAAQEELLPGPALSQLLREHAISTVTLTPTSLAVLGETTLPVLETLVVAGEACPPELMARWAGGRTFFNAYGPTETTVCASMGQCYVDDKKAGIGSAITECEIYLLDRDMLPVPVGVAGEVYIGGIGLARGYKERPDLTAERFVPHPFTKEPGARLYRTGDIARRCGNDTFEYLGRNDQQVKIRGYRIEPGEIEAVLHGHPAIQGVLVAAHRAKTSLSQLIAYVAIGANKQITAQTLKQYMKESLPEYMVPAHILLLEALPMTPSGKTDRQALLQLPIEPIAPAERFVAPRTKTEETLNGIWKEVLGHASLSIHDNFFEVGGHSLLVGQLLSRIRTVFHVRLTFQQFFTLPTIAELAAWIEEALQTTQRIRTRPALRARS